MGVQTRKSFAGEEGQVGGGRGRGYAKISTRNLLMSLKGYGYQTLSCALIFI